MTLPEDRRFERGVLPVSHFGLNWPDFFAKYPLPDVFSETVYLWDKSRLADLQNDRFKEILNVGWSNSYYRQLWSSAEVRHETLRRLWFALEILIKRDCSVVNAARFLRYRPRSSSKLVLPRCF